MFKRKRKVVTAAFLALVLLSWSNPTSASAAFWDPTGFVSAHDPSIMLEGSTWIDFSTGPGIQAAISTNGGTNWVQTPAVIPSALPWWNTYVPPSCLHYPNEVWAPDAKTWNGRVWLYYAVSCFGTNTSLIGLQSAPTALSGAWTDNGVVINSNSSVDYNTIDPNLVIDASNNPWLVFGSWFSGIKVTQLNPTTMKPSGGPIYSIAARPEGIEGASMTYRNGYYYLFASVDHCCQGSNSDYKIVVGRSTSITGPFIDKHGFNMMGGGGTPLDVGNVRWHGPGGESIFNNNVIVRHAYDAYDAGNAKLLINDLYWDSLGWPTYNTNPPLTEGIYKIVNMNSGKDLEVYGCSTADGAMADQWQDTTCYGQFWTFQATDSGNYKLINARSKKLLEVIGNSSAWGAVVGQWGETGYWCQQWSLLDSGGGYFKLRNRNSGLLLGVSDASTSNGAQLIQWGDNGTNDHLWKLVRVN